jgi:DNA-binding protein YbaB
VAVVTDHGDQVAELLADYRRSREQLASVQRTLRSINETASSPDGLVTATVGPHGNLISLDIAAAVYQRYPARELSALIVRTVSAAATRAAARAGQTLAAALPADVDPAALLAGTGDLRPEEYTPRLTSAPEPQQPARGPYRRPADDHDEESYEDVSWMGRHHGRRA